MSRQNKYENEYLRNFYLLRLIDKIEKLYAKQNISVTDWIC